MGLSSGNAHRYTAKLLALEAAAGCAPLQQEVVGFMPMLEWEPYLKLYPDQRLAAFLRRGIKFGFRIGFRPASPLGKNSRNHQSVESNPQAVSAYIADEVAGHRLELVGSESVHTSPMGLIPKARQPGKFRLICDLSSPQGASVNDGIDPELCSLQYANVDDAVALVKSLGAGTLIAKLDLKSAYRMVPVHHLDQRFLGIRWQNSTFCDRALPFGLRSAPLIFTAVADGLAWAMGCNGIQHVIHYLDDFLLAGPPQTDVCTVALRVAVPLCAKLGLPVAPNKVEGPTTVLTFLGLEIDTLRLELRLPQDKIIRLRDTLREWYGRRDPTKRQLQSLIGLLSHAATVVKPGRTFMRHLINTMKVPKQGDQKVRLNAQCMADIHWWAMFVESWNGISFFGPPRGDVSVVSDASGSWGCGAFLPASGAWFQFQWPPAWSGTSIAAKEMFPVLVSAALWGRYWSGVAVEFVSDNMSVVQALTSRRVRDPLLMHMLRCLFFLEARFGFDHVATHIPGKDNSAADALSRNRLAEFFAIHSGAPRMPVVVPPQLYELLSSQNMEWTDARWRELFTAVLYEVSHV